MKIIPSHCLPKKSFLLMAVGIGCALATSPIAAFAQEGEAAATAPKEEATATAAKEEASKPQPGDPTASKKGELNQAKPGGTVKLTAKEVAFVKKAGAGNAAEIKMAELALKNAESQDVKDFAQMMITDHTAANEQLAEVAKNHNITFPPDAPEKEKEMGKKMLDIKGAAFDKMYVMHAVTDHTKDVAEYKEAQKELKDEKLVEYVNKVEPIVAGHLVKAKEMEAKMKK